MRMKLRAVVSRMHREDGVAMFVALTVTFVVLMLSVVVIGQSIRSLDTSAYDRRRLFSIHAAEAGLNDWYRYLQATPIASLGCSRPDGALDASGAGATYSTTAVFLWADQTAMDVCDGTDTDTTPFSETVLPAYVLITSEGRASGQVPRTMETFMRITPRRGGFDAAVMASSGASFANNSSIGSATSGSGDVYVTSGNLSVNQQLTVSGSLYVPNGSASVSGSTVVNGDLWARDNVTLSNPATVRGDVLSSLGNVSGTGTVIGDVVAAGTVATGTLSIGGVATSNTDVDAVPTQSLPQIGWNQAYWENAGYTNVYNAASGPGLTQCQDAYNFAKSRWTGVSTVVRITDTCTLRTFEPGTGNVSMSLKGNLAFVSEGGYDFSRQSTWSEASTHSGGVDLFFISTWTATSPCPVSKDISVGNNTNFVSPNVSVLFYSPCKVTMSNQTGVFSGQVMGGTVNIGQNFSMLYEPVYVPGYGTITGFDQDIAYIREI